MTIFAWLLLCLAVIQYGASEERSSSARHSIAALTTVLAELGDDTFERPSYTNTSSSSLFSTQSIHSTYSNDSTELGLETDDRSQNRRFRRSSQSEVDRLQKAYEDAVKTRDTFMREVIEATYKAGNLSEKLSETKIHAEQLEGVYNGTVLEQNKNARNAKAAIINEIMAEERMEVAASEYDDAEDSYGEEIITHLYLVKDLPNLLDEKKENQKKLDEAGKKRDGITQFLKDYDDALLKQRTDGPAFEKAIKDFEKVTEAKKAREKAKNRRTKEKPKDKMNAEKEKMNTSIGEHEKIVAMSSVLKLEWLKAMKIDTLSAHGASVKFNNDILVITDPGLRKEAEKHAEYLALLSEMDGNKKIIDFIAEHPVMKAKSLINSIVATEKFENAEKTFRDVEEIIRKADLIIPKKPTEEEEMKKASEKAVKDKEELSKKIETAKNALDDFARKDNKTPLGVRSVWGQMKTDAIAAIDPLNTAKNNADTKYDTAFGIAEDHEDTLEQKIQLIDTALGKKTDTESKLEVANKDWRLAKQKYEAGKNAPGQAKAKWDAAKAPIDSLQTQLNDANNLKMKKESEALNSVLAIDPSLNALQNAKNELAQALLKQKMDEKDAAERKKLLIVVLGILGGFVLISIPIIIGVIFYVRHRRWLRLERERVAAGGLPTKRYLGSGIVIKPYDPSEPTEPGLIVRKFGVLELDGSKTDYFAALDEETKHYYHDAITEVQSQRNEDPEDLSLQHRRADQAHKELDEMSVADLTKIGVTIQTVDDPETGEGAIECHHYKPQKEDIKFKEPTEWQKQKELYRKTNDASFNLINRIVIDAKEDIIEWGDDWDDNYTLKCDRIVMNPHMLEKEDWTKEKRALEKEKRAKKMCVGLEELHDSHKTHDRWREIYNETYGKRVASDESDVLLLDPPDEELETTFLV